MILYLHGFRSSPLSYKARLLGQRMAELGCLEQYIAPALPPSPQKAVELASSLVESVDPNQLTIFGSSLGGFYATWLAEKIGCKAVVLNPAVKPPMDIARYVGTTTYYHSDETFEFKPSYVDELCAMVLPGITQPERYFLIAAQGDEVLDWRDMVSHYQGAQQLVLAQSDHGLSDFDKYIDKTLTFAGVLA